MGGDAIFPLKILLPCWVRVRVRVGGGIRRSVKGSNDTEEGPLEPLRHCWVREGEGRDDGVQVQV